jgi:hypothetical protein
MTLNLAQQDEYKVLTKSGKVALLNEASVEVTELSIGDMLFYHDRIQIKPGGYVVLVDSSLQSIELSEHGIYEIANIDTLISQKHNSITENITKFILGEMSTSKERYNEMKTLGAVVRKSPSTVEIAAPKFGKVLDTLYNFKWHPLPNESSYIFRLFNREGNTLFMKEYMDTSVTLNLSEFNLQFEQDYFWNVFSKKSINQRTDSVSFRLMNPANSKKIKSELKDINKDLSKNDSPLNEYIIAKYLISNELNEYAIRHLNNCIKMLPDSEFYWSNYIQFMLDVGLTKEAIALWSKSPFSVEQ